MTTQARRAALDPLLNWMAERILEQLLAEAATRALLVMKLATTRVRSRSKPSVPFR